MTCRRLFQAGLSFWPIISAWREIMNGPYDIGSKADDVPGADRLILKRSANFREQWSSCSPYRTRQSAPKQSWRFQLALGGCFIAVHGYSSDDTRKAFENACGLSVVIGERHKEIQAIFGLWGHHWMRARHDKAIELGETLIAKAKEINDPVAVMVGHRSLGSTLFTLGNFVLAREHLDRAIALGRESRPDGSSLSLSSRWTRELRRS